MPALRAPLAGRFSQALSGHRLLLCKILQGNTYAGSPASERATGTSPLPFQRFALLEGQDLGTLSQTLQTLLEKGLTRKLNLFVLICATPPRAVRLSLFHSVSPRHWCSGTLPASWVKRCAYRKRIVPHPAGTEPFIARFHACVGGSKSIFCQVI